MLPKVSVAAPELTAKVKTPSAPEVPVLVAVIV